MDDNKRKKNKNDDTSSLISQWLFTWAYPVLRLGLERPLQSEDLPKLQEQDTSAYNRMYMENLWKTEQQRATASSEEDNKPRRKRRRFICFFHSTKHASLFRALFKDYFCTTWNAQLILVISMAARLGQSIALGYLIEQFVPAGDDVREQGENDNTRMGDGYTWACIMICCGVVFLLCKQQQFFITYRKGMTMRLGLVATIYSKALKLPSIASGGTSSSSGQVINLASNDVERYLSGSPLMIYLIYGPIEAIAVLITGLHIMGSYAFIAGFALILLVFIPLQFYLARKFATLRQSVATFTDERVNLVSQAIQGVRVMKVHGWEDKFAERIANIRSAEMDRIISASRYKSLNEAIHFSSSVAVSVVTFSVHVAIGGTLSSRIVFTAMSMINLLQSSMSRIFSSAVMYLSECYVSSRRIQMFLESPELVQKPMIDCDVTTESDNEQPLVRLSEVTCYWDANIASMVAHNAKQSDTTDDTTTPFHSATPKGSFSSQEENGEVSGVYRAALRDINLSFHPGRLYCVIGPVGSSKSALLQAIAGELPLSSGSIDRRPTTSEFIAYAQQDPWIMDGTVKENITFGRKYKEDWYERVIYACGLWEDLDQFPQGDATIVGDRGVQLSGGQRARISLSRAIYRDADVVLLDDPLSAVDSKVGRHIFYSAIQELCVEKGKCVVLATHQHQFVGESECILMIKGKVECRGPYSACIDASGGKLSSSFQHSKDKNQAGATTERRDEARFPPSRQASSEQTGTKQSMSGGVAEEDRNTGFIQRNTWDDYANAMGGVPIAVALFVLFVTTQASQLICIVYIGEWAEQPSTQQDSSYWLGLIFGLATAMIFFSLLRVRSTFYYCIKASQWLHDSMTASVLRAKIEFFDTNPLGRILNRFAADVGIADDQLPLTLVDFLVGAFLAAGSVATTIVSLPMTLVALPPLLWYFVRLRKIFVTTTRELKRLEGLSRSPIYAMIGESLSGVATIRTNNAIEHFRKKFEMVHDEHGRAFFAFVGSSRWFATRMDFIAWIFMSLTAITAVLFQDQGWFAISPAVLGLTLTLLLQMAGTNFPWVVRQSAEVVNQMISIERVSAYGHLPSEADLIAKFDDDIGAAWPLHPSITITDLTVRYRSSLPPALNGVSFRVGSGQIVGIIGRTGSGKSSLVQTLCRILEAEKGMIEIDGVDISKLGLHKLRQSLSVVNQSPVLFCGCSVRFNLDPFDVYDEDTLRSALSDVQMLEAIDELPGGLELIVAEGGSNFSVGQRQLLCLARAILRKSKILILDESSANIDSKTDEAMQAAVAKSFEGATILSVAHRLDSVIDHDMILVLGEGKVLEFGSPSDLLSSENGKGHFLSMVESTGEKMAKSLKMRASTA